MNKPPPDQLALELPQDEPSPRRKRPRRRRTVVPPVTGRVAPRKPASTGVSPLLRDPVNTRCGLCGAAVTVFEDAAVCPSCRAIVGRPPRDE
jgi:hypothetical protein